MNTHVYFGLMLGRITAEGDSHFVIKKRTSLNLIAREM